ncbi:ATP-binding protein [Streptomyces purpurogeneiscleroticus]|uniref:ATP-binding protein n=1 Tax=Streptomyces purpurogeneiscleroticus TaxID=68259 RepID=UPI001CC1788A|nr:ATP-binding protein [Streptomyces purpurogeneiscleroticus]
MNDTSDTDTYAFPTREYRISLRVGTHSPRHVRRVVRALVRLWGLAQLADAAELVVTELLVNVYRHVPDRRCTVAVRRHEDGGDGVVVAVHDDHPVLPAARDAGPWEECGRGLGLVAAAADKWGVAPDDEGPQRTTGKTVWCELRA